MYLMILYLLIALLFSFLCSVMEAVILSVTPSFITKKVREGKPYAAKLKKFKDNIDRPLAAILTLNTFAHTIGAAGVGAQAQAIWGNEYLSVISIILTLLILIFSEIIPKTLGANYWMYLTRSTVYLLSILVVILYPFILISQLITALFNIRERKSVLSRADFSAMAEIATEGGLLEEGESKNIHNIARFNKLKTKDIMTPRTVVFAVPDDMKIMEFYRNNPDCRFSRIPLFNGSMDDVTSYILKDEILIKLLEGEAEKTVSSIARKLAIVYLNLPIPQLYKDLTESNEHIALVVDEFGGTSGIVTLEDVIETILGFEIVDEMDNIEDLQKAAREKWRERAKRMDIDAENL
jgi:CBS domain containing-hemolysin-like protein